MTFEQHGWNLVVVVLNPVAKVIDRAMSYAADRRNGRLCPGCSARLFELHEKGCTAVAAGDFRR
jgi:hypothetical protein